MEYNSNIFSKICGLRIKINKNCKKPKPYRIGLLLDCKYLNELNGVDY